MKLQGKLLVIIFSTLILFGLCAGITVSMMISSYGEDEIKKIGFDHRLVHFRHSRESGNPGLLPGSCIHDWIPAFAGMTF